jgi:hypothetical protein
MLTVTASLSQAFELQLSLHNIPDQQRRDFHKWLRFYLDFCNKYTLDPKLTASFAGFNEKLKSKGQSDTQRMEARRSIAMYYRMIGTLQSPSTPSSHSTAKNANSLLSSTPSGTPSPDSTGFEFRYEGADRARRQRPKRSYPADAINVDGCACRPNRAKGEFMLTIETCGPELRHSRQAEHDPLQTLNPDFQTAAYARKADNRF